MPIAGWSRTREAVRFVRYGPRKYGSVADAKPRDTQLAFAREALTIHHRIFVRALVVRDERPPQIAVRKNRDVFTGVGRRGQVRVGSEGFAVQIDQAGAC